MCDGFWKLFSALAKQLIFTNAVIINDSHILAPLIHEQGKHGEEGKGEHMWERAGEGQSGLSKSVVPIKSLWWSFISCLWKWEQATIQGGMMTPPYHLLHDNFLTRLLCPHASWCFLAKGRLAGGRSATSVLGQHLLKWQVIIHQGCQGPEKRSRSKKDVLARCLQM